MPTRRPTPTFDQGDIVKVPFPYTSRPTRQFRPALVVSVDNASSGFGLLWVVMITSAENRGWPGDIALAPSLARPVFRSPLSFGLQK